MSSSRNNPVVRLGISIFIALLALLVQGQGQELESQFRTRPDSIPDRFIVVLTDEAAGPRGVLSGAPALAAETAAVYGAEILYVYTHALNGFALKMPEEAARLLAEDPRVDFVEGDSMGSVADTQVNPPWGLDRIDQRDLPLSNSYTYDNTGAGVNGYVIDTGIRPTHQDFGGRAFIARDFVGDGREGHDCHGHGTHVAGTLGGTTYGVAKGIRIHALRALNCVGDGRASQAVAAVDWVTANRVLPAVVNMSIHYSASDALDTAVRNSIATGITYVVAAGNDNRPAGSTSPQRVAEAIIVGATESTDRRASFSNFGPLLDVFAPGVGILSAWFTSDTASVVLPGTSMASPHVAGVAALYLQGDPGASPATVSAAITGSATVGRVIDPGAGSPNLLLYSLFSQNQAVFVSQSVPTSMVPGQSYTVSVTMRNTGTTTWTQADGYKLGSQNPQDTTTWGTNRVELPATTPAGQEVTFTFVARAPATPGMYDFQWRMLQDLVEWFGAFTANVLVTVGESAPAPSLSLNQGLFCPGEAWTITVSNGAPASSITLVEEKWIDDEWRQIYSDVIGQTDDQGRYVGTFAAPGPGTYRDYVVIAGQRSNYVEYQVRDWSQCP